MKKLFFLIIFAGLWLPAMPGAIYGADETELLPELRFPMPESSTQKEYLGLSGKGGETFSVRDIDADIVVLELFSMYCPYCQREAPNVNELYRKMEDAPPERPKMKIIGIGASNSRFEVDHFRDTYDVQFPLFPDKDMAMYKALSGAGTPGFLGVRLKKDAPPVIFLRNSGGFYTAEEFLQDLVDEADM